MSDTSAYSIGAGKLIWSPETSFGNTHAARDGITNDVSAFNNYLGEINYDTINRRRFADNYSFGSFYGGIGDYIKARLGHPVVRVELTNFQILTAIDEAIAKMDYHAPDWCLQFMTFKTEPGYGIYRLPKAVINNLRYCAYKKSLLSIARQNGTLEFDFFLKYFQDNYLMRDFSPTAFLQMKMGLESLRKILSMDGTFDVINGDQLQLYPSPTFVEEVIVEFKALNSDTLHPYFIGWIQKYATATCKVILGGIRGKYAVLPSPQGGAQLNGAALVQEGNAERQQLEQDLLMEIEEPATFTMF
jgi:hypothetical protein